MARLKPWSNAGEGEGSHSEGVILRAIYDFDHLRQCDDRGRDPHPFRGVCYRCHCRVPVPWELRATLIPLIAVPVSIIGAFAVLLAMGYSANTVSLLAMVLAIGIVVDDAIVVVENVERVMEEEPEFSPAAATKKAMGQITAPIIAITLVLLSVFVPLAFIPGISGELFRQFAVTISASMLLSAAQLPYTLTRTLRRPLSAHGSRRGIMGWVSRRIDNVRDGYATIVGKTLRLSILSLALVVAFGAGTGSLRSGPPRASCQKRIRASSSSRCSCPMPPPSLVPIRGPAGRGVLQGMPQVKDSPRSSVTRSSTASRRVTPPLSSQF